MDRKILGIINFENDDINIDGLSQYHSLASSFFFGRYRLIDFTLSNFSNSNITHINIFTKNYVRNVFDHVGNGSHYDINIKQGLVNICPNDNYIDPFYYNDINAFLSYIRKIQDNPFPYVVISPSYFIYRVDYNLVLKEHIDNNSDITILYKKADNCKEEYLNCSTLNFDDQKRVISIGKNIGKYKNSNISLQAYIIDKDLFISLIKKAYDTSALFTLENIINDSCVDLNIKGYSITNNVYCINSLSTYIKSNLDFINEYNYLDSIKDYWPIYTKTNDSPPTIYTMDAKVKRAVIANGCIIEGEIENCIVGRNVIVKKGAIIKNSIITSRSFIGSNAYLNHVLVDKGAIVTHVKKIEGTIKHPIYIKRYTRV